MLTYRLFFFYTLLYILSLNGLQAQEMTGDKLQLLITQEADSLAIKGSSIQFLYKQMPMMCIYDENANRMRIIAPITETKEIEEEHLLNMLVANFHSALDVKYALSDEIIWSVFIHPLKELSEGQVQDAMSQVYAAALTFGDTYTSTNLVFPGNTKKKEQVREKKLIRPDH